MSGPLGPCVWWLCPRKADDSVLDVELVYEGRTYRKPRVPLCNEHMREAGTTGRMNLNPGFLLAQAILPPA